MTGSNKIIPQLFHPNDAVWVLKAEQVVTENDIADSLKTYYPDAYAAMKNGHKLGVLTPQSELIFTVSKLTDAAPRFALEPVRFGLKDLLVNFVATAQRKNAVVAAQLPQAADDAKIVLSGAPEMREQEDLPQAEAANTQPQKVLQMVRQHAELLLVLKKQLTENPSAQRWQQAEVQLAQSLAIIARLVQQNHADITEEKSEIPAPSAGLAIGALHGVKGEEAQDIFTHQKKAHLAYTYHVMYGF